MNTSSTISRPVIHRVCAWCKQDLGDIPCPAGDPNEGKTSHGVCPECQAKLLAEMAQMKKAGAL